MSSSNSTTKFSTTMAKMSRRSITHHGHPDAVTHQLGEELRHEYLSTMKKQTTQFQHQPDWFREQLGGREALNALSTELVELPTEEVSPSEDCRARLDLKMQGRSFSYSAEATAIFIGRETHCDAVTTPITDISVSRVSAILYPQPMRGLLFICDPGNLSGIRLLSREHGHLGLSESVPFSRNVLTLRWGERAEVCVCGVCVSFFPTEAVSVVEVRGPEFDERSMCRICLDQPRSRCFLPCRHQVCCTACADALLARSLRLECPICRSAIVEVVPIEEHEPNRSFAATRKRKRNHLASSD